MFPDAAEVQVDVVVEGLALQAEVLLDKVASALLGTFFVDPVLGSLADLKGGVSAAATVAAALLALLPEV